MSKRKVKASAVRVNVLNAADGCGHIPLPQAKRFVREGRAEWVGSSVRFLETDYRHQSAVACASRYEVTHQGEGVGMASFDAVKHLPVAGPAIKVFIGKRQTTPPVDQSTVLLDVRPSEPYSA